MKYPNSGANSNTDFDSNKSKITKVMNTKVMNTKVMERTNGIFHQSDPQTTACAHARGKNKKLLKI